MARKQPFAVSYDPATKEQEDVERVLPGHSPKLQKILERARKRFRDGAGIPHEAFWQEVAVENAETGGK